MTNSQSKFVSGAVSCTCREFNHPWTASCVNASAGIFLAAIPGCLRVYCVVYMLSLLMRFKRPTYEALRRTFLGMLQSSGFLVTNSFMYVMWNCIFRNVFGQYYFLTAAFLPAFTASLMALPVERPARRPMLALYVANLATEAAWSMAEWRGYVKSIPNGQVAIFGVSVSVLLYLYRLGLHKTLCKDPIFKILKIFVGQQEEGEVVHRNPSAGIENVSRPPLNLTSVVGLVAAYGRFVKAIKEKHFACRHRDNCAMYATIGGLKPLLGGVGIQVALKLLMNVPNLLGGRMQWRKHIFNRNNMNLGLFLGSFSFLYKSVSCILRHAFDRDDPKYAIPAGLVGSLAFLQYPDITVALYVMWKMLQLVYNLGVAKGLLPEVPYFIDFLYAFSTGLLFHSGIVEPDTLRPSYFKFLETVSAGRLCSFDVQRLEPFGLKTFERREALMKRLNMVRKSPVVCAM